jgi:intracellular sulfur oxidation DsrE/DsrF family protein
MNRRHLIQHAVLAAAATFLVAAHAQTTSVSAAKRHKLILQVSDNDPAKWNLALNNAKNVQQDVGAANVDIEIVAYGPGIGMLKFDSAVTSRITEASKSGIKVVACENTMHAQKLAKSDMNPNIDFVPAGVSELMTKQAEGWSYVRP